MQETPTTLETRGDPDLTGQELGDYRVLRRLGRGGMAEVYLAEQVSLGRQVALKVLKRDLASDETYVRRFHHEARAAAALVHANIVQIYEVGRLEGLHYITQEYVCGQNLKQLLARRSEPVNAALAVTIMRQVAAALHKAAAGGIVHRDIKPENIMITREGEVKVADFGLARLTGQGLDITQVGVTMGTPLYMSPEQVEGRKVDPRSDLYSFGVTCYHMLAGRPPFEGDTPLAVAVQHLRKEPERLEDVRHDLPEGLCRVIHHLLAKSPDQRPATAGEVLRDLRALPVEGLTEDWPGGLEEWSQPELVALSQSRVEATQRLDALMKSTAARRQRGRRGWIMVALAAALAFVVGAAIAWFNAEPDLLEEGARRQRAASGDFISRRG